MNTTPSGSEPRPNFLIRFYRWLFSWNIARRVLLCSATLVTLIALLYVVEDWRGKRAWNNYHHQMEAEGFRLDMASFIPAPVPDDHNFAAIPLWQDLFRYEVDPVMKQRKYRGVESHLGTNGFTLSVKRPVGNHANPQPVANWETGIKVDLTEWQNYFRQTNAAGVYEFPVSEQSQSPAADVLLAMNRFDSDLDTIRQAAQRPLSRFPIRYEDNFEAIVPHLAQLRNCAQVLQLRSVAELELGQSDQALKDICLSMRLAESTRTEPFMISHYARIAIVSMTLQPIWEGLAAHRWSDSELATLDRELAKFDFLSDFQFVARGVISTQVEMLERLRQSRDFTFIEQVEEPSKLPQQILPLLIPGGWFYRNQITCVRVGREWVPTVDTNRHRVFPLLVGKATEAVSDAVERWTPYNYLARRILHVLGTSKFASCQVSIDEARIACALERYRLSKGSYPETLAELAPKYLERVPHDIISGKELIYKRTDDGQFQLYSVGWNGKDDGGNIGYTSRTKVRTNPYQGDWVWPNAADARQVSR